MGTASWIRASIGGTLCAILLVGDGTVLEPPATPTQDDRPNIIVIVTDDQTIGTLRAMPRVRALLQEQGTTYPNAYVTNPLCCPSRASILTGQYSHHTMTYTNRGIPGATDPWRRFGGTYAFHDVGTNEARTIAAYLHADGYYTGLVGKYLNGYAAYADRTHGDGSFGSGASWKPTGWDRWAAFYAPSAGDYLRYQLNVDGDLQRFGSARHEHSTRVLGDEAVRFIQTRPADRPFFLFFAPRAGHGRFIPEPRDEDLFRDVAAFDSPAVRDDVRDKPRYIRRGPRGAKLLDAESRMRLFQTLYGLDRQVGRIVAALTPEELANTLIVYLSDNGLGNGEHQWGYKLVPYERSIRVPLIVRWNGHLASGVRDDRFVLNVDLLPTLLEAAGHEPVPTDGVSIDGPSERRTLLLESMYFPRGAKGSVPTYCGIVTHRWKYVVYSPTRAEPGLVLRPFEEELYDRSNDPWELRNVAPDNRAKVRDLRDALAELCDPPPPDTRDRWWNAWAA